MWLMHFKSDGSNLVEKIKTVQENTFVRKRTSTTENQQAAQESSSLGSQAKNVKGIKLLVRELNNVEPKMLRTMVDDLKNQLGSAIIVLSNNL
ncbi:DHH family phosphoesterase [Enterobacter hormaechei]